MRSVVRRGSLAWTFRLWILPFLSLGTTGTAAAVVLSPTADAHVRDGSSANSNFGTATVLEVRTSNSGQNRDAYLKFDVTSVSGITSARLRIRAALSGSGSVSTAVHPVAVTTWTETGITWNNRPALGGSLASVTVSGTAYAWYELDVTAYVQAEKAAGRNIVSLALHGSSSNRIENVKSRESTTERPELVVLGNAPPAVAITSPANGASFPQPATIVINATASDSDGTISKVEFFQGTTNLGEDTTSPYSFTWSGVLAGGYSLTARATDNAGATTTSSAVSVTVTEGGPTVVSGFISTNRTWSLSASPYVVTGNVLVWSTTAPGPVLTIEPGVVVKFNAGTGLYIGEPGAPFSGQLQAVGTAERPITFTANTASPTPGYWQAIQIHGATSPVSRISYSTVRYGGVAGNFGSIRINGSSPILENVTLRDSAHAGVSVEGAGSPQLVNSTLTANALGMFAVKPSAPSLQNVAITNNTGYAAVVDPNVTFGAVSGVTATGNGTNAVQFWTGSSTVDRDTTWRSFGIPYVVSSDLNVAKQTTPAAVLTIVPGVTIKFSSARTFVVGDPFPGQLQAVGTVQQPITFTANTATPTPGYWQSLHFYAGAGGSRVAYATVSYAGLASNWGGIRINGSSPSLDHVRFDSNAYVGLTLHTSSATVENCDFTNNTGGVVNQTPGTIVDARRNWWASTTGPSGSGGGTGQSVSAGVRFEPWLGAPGSAPQFFETFGLGNTTFNPTLNINANFSFTSTLSGNWRLLIYTGADALIRTITGSGSSGAPSWDGRNDSGVLQPNGTYRYQIESTTAASESAAPLRGFTAMDTARQLVLTGAAAAPAFFSPNGDGVQETTAVTGSSSFDGATWTMNFRNGSGQIVRTATGPANPAISYAWDGRNGSGALQPDGPYTVELLLDDGSASTSASLPVTLDVTLPTAAITQPTGAELYSNVFVNGQTNIDVLGTSADANLNNWTLDYGAGASPASWTVITNGTQDVSSGALGTWATLSVTNGLYSLRLRTWDKAGNVTTAIRTPTIGNFTMSQSALQFNAGSGQTVVYTSRVPFNLNQTLVVKNLAGQTVRTLVAAARTAGTYNDTWNGRNDAGALLPDGPYFYVSNVNDGACMMTWDLTNEYINDGYQAIGYAPGWPNNAVFEPFNNTPLAMTYQVHEAVRLYVLFTPDWESIGHDQIGNANTAMCGIPGNFCMPFAEYRAPGFHNFKWMGIDNTGAFRNDIRAVCVIVNRETFSRNAVVTYGTRPTIEGLTVGPTYFAPARGLQTLTFTLGTYQSQPATVRLTVTNLASRSVLRTVTLPGVAPGAVSIQWDGRADGGLWVAPGRYSLDVTAIDQIGNTMTLQTLTSVDY